MKIAVVQASSQASKNEMLYKYTKKYAKDADEYYGVARPLYTVK